MERRKKAEDSKQNPQYSKMNLNKATTIRRQREAVILSRGIKPAWEELISKAVY